MRIGSVVWLEDNDLTMTVEDIFVSTKPRRWKNVVPESIVKCTWFSPDNSGPHYGTFGEASLRICKE